MVFDPQLSDDIPLPMVLDELLASNEKPDVVMAFLKEHESVLGEILSHSLYAAKIPNLDFFEKLERPQERKLFWRIVSDFLVGYPESWLFVNQVWEKWGQDSSRFMPKEDLSAICVRASSSHPIPKPVKGNCLDALFLEPGSSIYYVAEKINTATDRDFDDLLAMYSPFLFEGRILQDDLFNLIDDSKKLVFLNNMKFEESMYWPRSIQTMMARFTLQILCGNDDGIRLFIANKLRNSIFKTTYSGFLDLLCISPEDERSILETDTFEELFIDYAVKGMDTYVRGILFALLVNGKDRMLRDFAENEPNLVEKYLPVGGILDKLKG